MGFVLAFAPKVYFSLDWRWRSPQEDQIQHSLFQSRTEPNYSLWLNLGKVSLGCGFFSFAYTEPGPTPYAPDSFNLSTWELRAGAPFSFPLGFEGTAYLGLGLTRYDNWRTFVGGAGSSYSAGLDLLWGPPSWHAKALLSTGYRVIPGWFPGTLHHQWELGLGFRFSVLEG